MARFWDMNRRKDLEFYLTKVGYPVPKIAELMGVSSGTIYRELKRTLSPEEYAGRQYVKYTANAAIEKDVRILRGEE